jgi:acyl carrier protein
MSSDHLIERVRSLIAKHQRIPVEQVTADTTFEDLGMDSLDATDLLFSVEEEFDISIEDDAVKAFHSVRQVADGIEKVLSQTSPNLSSGG